MRPALAALAALTALSLLLAGSLASGLAAAAPPLMRVGVEADYGPFVYTDAAGQAQGLSVELLRRVAELGGFELKPLPAQPLPALLQAAQRGELDLLTSLRPTPARAEFLAFSAPYVEVPAVLVARGGAPRRLGLDQMRGQRVGVGRGYAVEAVMRQRHPDVLWQPMDDDADALRALDRGELDAVVADLASVAYGQRRLRLRELQVHQRVGFDYPLSFAYPKQRADVGALLNLGLHRLPPAERDALLARWLDAQALEYEDPRAALLSKAALMLTALALLLGSWALLRRTREPEAQP